MAGKGSGGGGNRLSMVVVNVRGVKTGKTTLFSIPSPNPVSQQPCIPPNIDDWDHLFQPMFDEYFNPPSIVVIPVQDDVAPRAVDLADSPVSTSID
ncbi:hypothetical protein Tco_0555711 [Tanacetum coccineum]